MTIEVTVPVVSKVAISFDVDPGTVITRNMINEKIDEIQQKFLDTIPAGSLYVQMLSVEVDSFDACVIDLYNRDTGEIKQIDIGDIAATPGAQK